MRQTAAEKSFTLMLSIRELRERVHTHTNTLKFNAYMSICLYRRKARLHYLKCCTFAVFPLLCLLLVLANTQ